MTSTHPLPPDHESPPALAREDLIRMYDGIMKHLAHARRSPPEKQTKSISAVVKILNDLKELTRQKPPREADGTDLSALYAYMIDRLSISHSGLGTDPIHEVHWLVRNLRDISTTPRGRRPVNG